MAKPLIRSIGHYEFEDSGRLQILVTGNVSTEEALDMVETLVALKRKELETPSAPAEKPSDR